MTVTGDDPQRTTLFEVERDARWRIWALFGLLVLVVWACLAPLTVLLTVILHVRQLASTVMNAYYAYPGLESVPLWQALLEVAASTAVLGLAIAALAWLVTRLNARARLLRSLHARPIDPFDTYHHRFANVVDELAVAAGLPGLDSVVIRSLSVNAVSFADPQGPACIGVTEGALARLSRPQLQAVVAHEVAHVASRDCVVATHACLLFLGVRRMAELYGRGTNVALVVGYLAIFFFGIVPLEPVQIGLFWCLTALLVWTAVWLCFWIATAGGSVVDLALSRQREYAADAAAVRFTRDPASLAEALLMIQWQQGAPQVIPRALAALSIAPASGERHAAWRLWFDTHPPLTTRIGLLESLAAKRGQSLWQRRADVQTRVEAREHAVPARAVVTAAASTAAAKAVLCGPDAACGAPEEDPDRILCPRCGAPLRELSYEGSNILECTRCGGVGATTPQVEAILARRDWGFTPEQVRIADIIQRYQAAAPPRPYATDTGARRTREAAKRPPLPLPWPTVAGGRPGDCPFCRQPMRRAPWSLAYPLPVDECGGCDLHWFDRDEIEVLQVLVERQVDLSTGVDPAAAPEATALPG